MRPLTLALNGTYFDQIAAGAKFEEYRLASAFWASRLRGRSYCSVVLTRGYPKAGGVEGVTRLTRRWNGFIEKEVTHPHFGDRPVRVFAIDVSAIAIEARQRTDPEEGLNPKGESAGLEEASPDTSSQTPAPKE